MTKGELLIENCGKVMKPVVIDGVTWSTERTGSAGKLTFKVVYDSLLDITEGNTIQFKWGKKKIFLGHIFKISTDKTGILEITAYDQLTYLVRNSDTYVIENKTASEVVKMIASDFLLNTGTIEDTSYKIASLVEDNSGLYDIIQDCLDTTVTNTGEMYVLYDDFGKLALKNIASMYTSQCATKATAVNYEYTSSIDDSTYNQIKLYYDNEDTGVRDVYIVKDSDNIAAWGILQMSESIEEGENGKTKAEALLKLYNSRTRSLKVSNMVGDSAVRSGSMIPVVMKLYNTKINNYMLVEKCIHTFKQNDHRMDLTLRGGEFNV